jgi:probable rRNA maturation factor
MSDPPSPMVVVSDEQDAVALDGSRWGDLARAVLMAEGRRSGELTLTFVDAGEIAELNREHMGVDGPTDVLSFPLDADADADAEPIAGVPVLLGDVVVCPSIAAANAPTHAGTLDDELALLVVHGVLHVLGHDHAAPDEAARMRGRELDHLTALHWNGPAPAGFRQHQESH